MRPDPEPCKCGDRACLDCYPSAGSRYGSDFDDEEYDRERDRELEDRLNRQ